MTKSIVLGMDIRKCSECNQVEVTRCKSCIHWYPEEEVCLKIYSDGAVSQYAWQYRKPDDFCSYGDPGEGRFVLDNTPLEKTPDWPKENPYIKTELARFYAEDNE